MIFLWKQWSKQFREAGGCTKVTHWAMEILTQWPSYQGCCCCSWLLLYSAILRSQADSMHSHVILHAWLAFYSPFLNILFLCGFYVALRPRRRDDLLGTGTEWERGQGDWLDRGNRPKKTGETAARTMEMLRRCPLAIAQRLVHCAIALSTAVLDKVTKTMSVAPLLTNNLDNSKQKTSNLLSPAPPPYSWSLLGKSEGPAPPPSSKISWSFDLAWNPDWISTEVVYL